MPSGLALATLLAVAAPHPASIAVVATLGDTGDSGLDDSSVQATLLEALELRPQLRPVRGEELFVGGDVQARIRDCGSDDACVAAALAAVDITYGLLVLVSVDGGEAFLDLRIVRSRDAERVAEASGLVTASLRGVQGGLLDRVPAMLDGLGYARWAGLQVEANPPGAEIEVHGPATVASGVQHELPPGQYRVLARAEGHLDTTRTVDLRAGERQTLRIELEAAATPPCRSGWFWGAVGAVVVGAAVTGAVLATRDPGECYCVTLGNERCMGCP